ncbi:MAG: hypothetical protein QGH74_01795 [Candidatus Brocadiia bacterium]|jgi:hypothetical protein|nr:hypothetical protein [Candidatus Brocadiia bacterium]
MSREHEVIFYTDGRHSSVYIHEPPMDERIYTAPIDELVDLGIDTITYCVGDCRVLLYDTRAGERWGHNVRKTNHIIWYRAGRNLERFIADGNDPLRVVCDRAHELGFTFMPSLILGMSHEERAEATNCRCSDFCFDHPEYQIGPEPDFPEAQWDNPARFSYAIQEVRRNRLAVIEELVGSYESDGIELHLSGGAPFVARREIPTHTETFTQFVRDVRALCDAAGKEQGRPKRLLLRAAATLAGSKALGIDLETMIREDIADTILAMPPHRAGFAEPHPRGIAELVEAARSTGVRIVTAVNTNIRHDAYADATREMQAALAANGYAVGAQGVFFHTYYPSGYPYTDSDLANLRFMGHPELLAHKDKHFFVCQGPNTADDRPGDYGSPHPLPVELVEGARGTPQSLYVSDDLAAWHAKGELARCELRVRLTNFIDTDTFELYVNDTRIPREHQEWLDWTYSVRQVPGNTRMNMHYWITVDLMRRGPLPAVGENTVRVDLKTHDPRVIYPVLLHDVELLVDYRDHRHAPRRDEWWRDPRQR